MIRGYLLGLVSGLALAYAILVVLASDDDTITESGGRAFGYRWTYYPDNGPWT